MDRIFPRSLEHPLPAGMRDLLPEEAAVRRQLSRRLLDRFELFGYRPVTPPAFELANVIERGLGSGEASDVLRFIEPESGEVAVLRPDMTPQIARIVATRMREHTPPYRIAYEGTVVRRRTGRAKKQRQIPQVGVELCGAPSDVADLELLELTADALRSAGLTRFTIDLSDAGIAADLLDAVPPERASEITTALATKDESRLEEATEGLDLATPLRALPRLHGPRAALEDAVKLLQGTRAQAASSRLLALYDAATKLLGDGCVLTADAGEVRGFAYYTGMMFSAYAGGPGEAIGGGGRYDELLARFGAPMAAAGFGIDLDALTWALKSAGARGPAREGVVYVGPSDDGRVAALRRRGIAAVAVAYHDAALAHARSWGHALVWNGASVFDVATGTATPVDVQEAVNADRDAALVARVLETLSRGA